KLGTQYCPDCHVPVEPQTYDTMVSRIMKELKGQHIGLLAPLVVARKGYYTDLAKWASNEGYTHLRVDGAFTPTTPWPRLDRFKEHTIGLPVADFEVSAKTEATLREALHTALEHGHGVVHVVWPLERLQQAIQQGDTAPAPDLEQWVMSVKRACPCCGVSFPEPDPRQFSYNSKLGWCPDCFGTGLTLTGFDSEQTGEESSWERTADQVEQVCPSCHGQRLNRQSLAVRWQGRSIAELAALSV